MKYALLIYEADNAMEALGDAERQAAHAEYMALSVEPSCVSGAQLQSVTTATTVQVRDGRALTTDGPFADTKEVFGGYYVFDVDDLDRAIELAARVPAARSGGSVEIRPLVEH
ncbi:MAG: YciI family protein [Solirubrobacteraceae bacterium]